MPTEAKPPRVVAILTDGEHAKLKRSAAASRRTLGRELAFLAFGREPNRRPRAKKEVAV